MTLKTDLLHSPRNLAWDTTLSHRATPQPQSLPINLLRATPEGAANPRRSKILPPEYIACTQSLGFAQHEAISCREMARYFWILIESVITN